MSASTPFAGPAWEVSRRMVDNGIGDYFINDLDDELLDEEELVAPTPVVVPQPQAQQAPPVAPVPAPAVRPDIAPEVASGPQPMTAPQPVRPQASVRPATREERLVAALDELMAESVDVQAAALVSLDGFTMASALPDGMQEDRVGAMSAAILGLGERAATELGRGHLTQVFIEGDDGYVVLIAAGDRAVLTTLARADAKLGLVLYDMKATADVIGEILN